MILQQEIGQDGSLSTTRNKHAASVLLNGNVLVSGGNSNGYINQAELYDPSTGI